MNNMAIRLVGAVVLTIAGLLIGRSLSSACVRRVAVLRAFRDALVPLELKMLSELLPLNQALLGSRYEVFRTLAQALTGERGAREAWEHIAESLYTHGGVLDALEDADREAIDRFFSELGMSGQEEQRALFARTAGELKTLEDAASGRATDVSKLYTTLGALGGMALAIALL